jgi:HSP20 family protein
MAITRWRDPFSMLNRLAWPIQDEDVWWTDKEGLTVYETDNDVKVEANAAGVPADKVDVSYEGGVLTIQAEYKETEEQQKKKKKVYKQAREARYYYTTSIPCPVKADKITAEMENGVLTVTLPKKEETKPKRIKVKAQSK